MPKRNEAPSLFLVALSGLIASSYLPFGIAGGFAVTSRKGLLWPAAVATCLLLVVYRSLRDFPFHDRRAMLLLVALGLYVIAATSLTLVPPIARDELLYHLALPAIWVREGRIVEVPFSGYAYYPMLVQMLYTPLIAQGWVAATKLLHLLYAVAAAFLLFAVLRPRCEAWVSFGIALALITTPALAVASVSAYVDLALVFFAVAAVAALLRWSEDGSTTALVLAGLCAGCLGAVKYNGMALTAVLAIGCLSMSRETTAARWRDFAIFCIAALLPCLPWLVKNFLQTGNPFYPLFAEVMGHRPTGAGVSNWTKRRVIYGESPLWALLAPVRMFFYGREGDPRRFDGVLNPFFLLGAALGFRLGASRWERVLVLASCGYVACVYLFAPFLVSRFVAAALVPLAFVNAAGLANLRQDRARRIIPLLLAAALVFNGLHFAGFWRQIDPFAYLIGRQTREEYITRFVPEYPLAAYANSALAGSGTVYLAFLGSRGYHWQVSYRYDDDYLAATLANAIRGARDAAAIRTNLHAQGLRYVAADERLLARFLEENLTPAERNRWRAFTAANASVVFRRGPYVLWRVE